MAEEPPDRWPTRLFLAVMALLLFGGLAYLGAELFRQLTGAPLPGHPPR